MTKPMRAALYLRVSTTGQTVENQRRDLEAAAAQKGWTVVDTFSDAGISGSKGRDKRPGLDHMLKDATRGKFDVVMAWSVDRMGRSQTDLLGTLQELHGAKVDLFLYQQGMDTTTPAGRAMFSMMGVFAEFERAMIVERVKAGLARAMAEDATTRKAKGKKAFGRPTVSKALVEAVTTRLEAGVGMLKIAKEVGVGTGTVQRIQKERLASVTA
jgi:DNA invertase Pin-like site-specific DNA recombinase